MGARCIAPFIPISLGLTRSTPWLTTSSRPSSPRSIKETDRKNWNFDKYCLTHVAEHNRHSSLLDYAIAPLEESMKIHYFEEGIKDPTLDAAWNAILVNRSQFPDFDSVMHL
jgi:hypothetical protein